MNSSYSAMLISVHILYNNFSIWSKLSAKTSDPTHHFLQ